MAAVVERDAPCGERKQGADDERDRADRKERRSDPDGLGEVPGRDRDDEVRESGRCHDSAERDGAAGVRRL